LRDLEVENGANAPRIHSMDDYFMIEVEKVVEIARLETTILCSVDFVCVMIVFN
jgi:hypothetical protein